jgi:chemotaxis protein MotA
MMTGWLGLLGVLGVVFGCYWLAGGSGEVLLVSGPLELAMILGAGMCTLFVANPAPVALAALKAPARVFAAPAWGQADYAALARLLGHVLSRVRQRGVVALEADIEAPARSPLFATVPALLRDPDALAMLCGVLRRQGTGRLVPAAAQAMMGRQIAQASAQRRLPVQALERLADALPALGIVAAVLGVIHAMAAIDQSSAVLGRMIASAMVGTLLGVLLSYGVVGPIAARLSQRVEEELLALEVIAEALLSALEGEGSQAAVEAGLAVLPAGLRPDMEAAGAPARVVALADAPRRMGTSG